MSILDYVKEIVMEAIEKAEKISRISYRVISKNPAHVRFHLWVNGGRTTSNEGLCLRTSEFLDFVEKLQAIPDSKVYVEHGLEKLNDERI